MTTLVFVHGIGLRDHEYPDVWPQVRRQIAEHRPDLDVRFCYWGDLGAELRFPVSATSESAEYGAVVESALGSDVDRWASLFVDPLWELAVLAEEAERDPLNRPVGSPTVSALRAELASRISVWLGVSGIAADLDRLGLGAWVSAAAEAVLDTDVVVRCLLGMHVVGAELNAVLARAIVAQAVRSEYHDMGFGPTGDDVDALADSLTDALGGVPQALGGSLGRLAVRLLRPHVTDLLRPATELAVAGRRHLMSAVTPYAGDVLRYLSRGIAIRERVRAFIAEQEPPVFVVAHSLGGVIMFDLLAAGSGGSVELFCTVGSQVSYLHGIDALPGLRRDAVLGPMPRWLNVYDPRDLLSFPAEPAFTGGRVRDVRVDTRMPFPMSHTAYFHSREFYRVLVEALP